MAKKTADTGNGTLHDNWFDLIPEEDRDELKAKQWQTEYRATDDESAYGNLHYGTDTERESLRDQNRQQDMHYVQPDIELSTDSLSPADVTVNRPADQDVSLEGISRQAATHHESIPSAEALSAGDISPRTINTPDIVRVETQTEPDQEPEGTDAIPEIHRNTTHSTGNYTTVKAEAINEQNVTQLCDA